MHLYLIRHGETEWNSQKRIQGHTDTKLNARGIAQAQKLAERMAGGERVDVIYTSPLARACVTAGIIGEGFGLEPVLDKRLLEQNFGEMEGLDFSEVEQRWPGTLETMRTSKTHLPLPRGETTADFRARLEEFLADIQTRHPGGVIAAVAHGGTINVILAALIGLPHERRWLFHFDNASLSRVDLLESGPRIRLLNDTCHLPQDLVT